MEQGQPSPQDCQKPVITPDMKVASLLQHYPELEDTLLGLSPTFGKLKNLVLRRTVAKIATLHQAAQIGAVPIGELINTLRREAGQDRFTALAGDETGAAPGRPAWVRDYPVRETLDARSMIEEGGHPLNTVMEKLGELGNGERFCLVTPFLPAPLIDVARSKGFDAWTDEEAENSFSTSFARPSE